MKIAIISHTEHYTTSEGQIVGWGATIREIDHLAQTFEEVIHLACLHPGNAPASALPYTQNNVRFVPLPPTGGKTTSEKLSVFTQAPKIWREVKIILPHVNAVQFRVPTGMGNYLLPLMTLRKNKPRVWVKYAGNWAQENPPLGYRFQRWWLKKNFLKCPVTINGKWPNQPEHCLTFENPCLDEAERTRGKEILKTKSYHPPYTGLFIGRLETPKGVGRIIDALETFEEMGFSRIHLVGDGPERPEFEARVKRKQSKVEVIFHGGMSRLQLVGLMEEAHFLLLPSTASEGFPKVIAEAANYGAVPMVSDVSSIGQYINDSNGFLWPRSTDFSNWLEGLDFQSLELELKANQVYSLAEIFTFEHYVQRLKNEVLHFEKFDYATNFNI